MARGNLGRVVCQTCGGEYDQVLPDGLEYFHACPPIAAVKVKAKDGTITIVPRTDDLDQASIVGEVALTREGARNENIHPFRRDAREQPAIIAEGNGVEPAAIDQAVEIRVPGAVGSRAD